MPPLIDFLSPLHHGVWEVTVPKRDVTEPLIPPWKPSPVNVPSPGTIASYRNGQYHAHETGDDYRVHLDRYDPKSHPVMHLVSDAPLALMLVETMVTLVVTAKDARSRDPAARLLDLRISAWMRLALGGLVLALGTVMLLLALGTPGILFRAIIPALVVAAGLLMLANGGRLHVGGGSGTRQITGGLALVAGGMLMSRFWQFYLVLILVLLATWSLSSAAVMLYSVVRERGRVPQGLVFTTVIGLASLLLGAMVFTNPTRLIGVLVLLLAVIALLVGALLVVDGIGMRHASGLIGAEETGVPPSAGA
ncbi:MAG: hypothetical protein GXY82_06750 [Methanospirillum sp.]|nr:hypothetical protein [Methanospirillum sp.]